MNDLTYTRAQLPDTIEDLTQFVLVGKAKLSAYMSRLQTVNKLSVAQGIRDQTLQETQELASALIAAEQRIGELLLSIPKASGGDRRSEDFKNTDVGNFEKTKAETIKEMGYGKNEAVDYQQMAQHPEVVQKVIEDAIANGDVVTKTQVMREIKALRDELKQAKEQTREVPPADYEDVKRKAKTYEKDFLKMQKLYGEMSEKWKVAEQQKEKLLAQIEDPDMQNEARIKTDAYSLCAGVSNFLERYGGHVYLMNEIDQLPDKEKKAVMTAVGSIYRWADEMLNNGMMEVVE